MPPAPRPFVAADDAPEAATDNVFNPPDRATMQRLSKAQELMEKKRYGEAVRFLGGILEEPEDFFFQPNRAEPIFRSLKGEAQRMLGEMPADGRESYELQFGARARQMLDGAARNGDAAGLAEVARRFFHTKAGYEATYLLGTSEMDHGRPLAAALCLARLQQTPAAERFEPALSLKAAACWVRAGMDDKAADTLAALRARDPDATVQIAGTPRKLFAADAEALAWLKSAIGQPMPVGQLAAAEQWTVYRGNTARNAISYGSSPLLNRRWAVPTTNDPYIEQTLDRLRQSYIDQGARALPALHPLAVGGYVFMRSVTGLEVIDFRTGKRVWNGPVDESVEQLLEPGGSYSEAGGTSPVSQWIEERVWDDATYGTLSSDGEQVYCVEDLGTNTLLPNQPQIVLPNGRLVSPATGFRTFNRLAAYEIATEGKLKWDVGAQPGDGELPLAGAYFLGPPLPLAGRLYVLAEVKGEIRLLCLVSQTGHVEWSQQLAVLEQTIGDDPLRRVAGVTPSYSDGILVCPTVAGAVVAVDLTTRSLLWGYQYPREIEPSFSNRMFGGVRIAVQPGRMIGGGEQDNRWCDASITIAEGHVLLTPPESDHLHCLNLLDGGLLWQKPREDGLYLGCAYQGLAMVVGARSATALNLADGEPAWTNGSLALPAGSMPSGQGFFNGQRYYLPLTSAEVAAIDIATGQIVARSKSRTGSVPGNLICYHGAVISQGADYLESFYQLEDLRRQVAETLAQHPDDPEALARQGELLLEEGRLNEAIDGLRRSFEIQPDPRTRGLLVDALLEGLRLDFAANRGRLDEVERLADQPSQRARFLRLTAAGLQASGDIVPAFETFLRIAGIGSQAGTLEQVDSNLSVRRDRWVQARLQELRSAANADEQEQMDQALRARLQAAAETEGHAPLAEFVDYFGSHPLADEARELLVARLPADEAGLRTEQLLRQLERSPDPQRARAAVARLAKLLFDAGRPDDAEPYLVRLAGPWADTVCLDGKTGRQLVEEWTGGQAMPGRWAGMAAWPVGQVEQEELKGTPLSPQRNFGLDFRGPQQPFFARTTVELDPTQRLIIGRDGVGRERWRVSLNERGEANPFAFNPAWSHVRANGHFLLLSLGHQLLGVDTLGSGTQGGARILWRKDLADWMPSGLRNVGIRGRVVQMPWGLPRFIAADANNRPIGDTGPLSGEIVCYQRSRNLTAIDLLSGDTLWVRHEVPAGCDLFGDHELLFVTEPSVAEALVVRKLDGHEMGRREVPPAEQRLVTLGRMVLTWSTTDKHASMVLVDAWDQKNLWERHFELGAKVWPIGDEAIGVLERSGHFVVLSLPAGAVEIDAQVDDEPALNEIYLFRTETHDLLVTNRPVRNERGVTVAAVPAPPGAQVINGFVHGFDRRTGEKVFSTRIENKGMTLQQPADLPVLIFASNVYQQSGQRRGQSPRGHVLCLDKRNGRIVYEENLSSPITNTVDIACDPQQHEVVLRTLRSAVKLKFTDKPIPPAAEPPAEAQTGGAEGSTPVKAGRAIARGFRKWIAGATRGGDDEAGDDWADEEDLDPDEEGDWVEDEDVEAGDPDVADDLDVDEINDADEVQEEQHDVLEEMP